MAYVTHKRTHKVPGYQLSEKNISDETQDARAASAALKKGRKWIERRNKALYVLCDGKLVPWEVADPRKIGK
jgi:hypothetical protein